MKNWFATLLLAIAIVVSIYFAVRQRSCEQAGGIYVRTLFGMKCWTP